MRREERGLPAWVTPVVAAGALVFFAIAEWRRPLRRRVEPVVPHDARNLALAGITAAVTGIVQFLVLTPYLTRIQRRRTGLLHRMHIARASRVVAGVLLLDYTLWWWHRANHQLPALWRFHLVHHVDQDLDSTTALRFHFGEMALSIAWRAAQFRILGIDPLAASVWQTALFVSILFQHANLSLPERTDRWLSRLVVTPRMHGIHHSDAQEHATSNWSSILSCWDFLHGTFREDVAQDDITIGVRGWHDPAQITLPRLLVIPFVSQRDDWSG